MHGVPNDDNTRNNPNVACTYDALYLKPKYNGLGHWVFKIKTMQALLVHHVIPALMSDSMIVFINQGGKNEGNPEGLLLGNQDNTQMLANFEPVEHLDDNASDPTYKSKDNSTIPNDHNDSDNEYTQHKQ